MTHLIRILALLMIVVPAKADMQTIEGFAIDRTEVSIAQFQEEFIDSMADLIFTTMQTYLKETNATDHH